VLKGREGRIEQMAWRSKVEVGKGEKGVLRDFEMERGEAKLNLRD
jgi:hypothetical protein